MSVSIDERFLTHRLRSTSVAGFAGVVVAMGLFVYRYSYDHFWSWDLFAVGATMALVKLIVMILVSLDRLKEGGRNP